MSCLHARGISDLPMCNGPGLQHAVPRRVRLLLVALGVTAAVSGFGGILLAFDELWSVPAAHIAQSSNSDSVPRHAWNWHAQRCSGMQC